MTGDDGVAGLLLSDAGGVLVGDASFLTWRCDVTVLEEGVVSVVESVVVPVVDSAVVAVVVPAVL